MSERRKAYVTALTIAGSDSSGGAGIQADLKTFAALGCYGMTVITAVTAQNTVGVTDCVGISARLITRQIKAVMDDIGADVIKTGMLYNADNVRAVTETLCDYRNLPLVVDPVMVSTSGSVLLDDAGITATKDLLFPMASVATPNMREAEILLGQAIGSSRDARATAAADLCRLGPSYVLLKGGHAESTRCDDVLLHRDPTTEALSVVWHAGPRVSTRNDHGTGCTLSAAAACFLAHGKAVPEAVRLAKAFVQAAITAGAAYDVGRGHGPLHHAFDSW